MQAIVAFGLSLETSSCERVLLLGFGAGLVGVLVGIVLHPRLLDLEIMGQVDPPPVALVVQTEFPPEIQTFNISLRIGGRWKKVKDGKEEVCHSS
jgi:hypothetical protein